MKKIYLIALCLGLAFGSSNILAQQWQGALKQLGNSAQTILNERTQTIAAKQADENAQPGGIARTARQILELGKSYKIKTSSEEFLDCNH